MPKEVKIKRRVCEDCDYHVAESLAKWSNIEKCPICKKELKKVQLYYTTGREEEI